MVLAVLREIYQGFGKQGLQRVSVTGIDIREILVKTAAVQIGANLVVQGIKENGGEPIEIGELLLLKGNALDPDEQWETIVHVGSHPAVGLYGADLPERKEAISEAARVAYRQGDLFEELNEKKKSAA